jgi:zinc transporter ZupT
MINHPVYSGQKEPARGVVRRIPFSLAFAAGAMLYVVCDEIVPKSHGRGSHREATFDAMLGFVVMMTLDNIFAT